MHILYQKWFQAIVLLSLTNLSVGSDQDASNIWAVLVAGSNEFSNYRHQADVCHAYQILVKNGVPKEQIIVLMYDDIAYNEENPTPGIIINHINGSDVYQGVQIDYKGKDVTPEVFTNVLLGNETALQGVGTGRVLKSTEENHVFINFVDHGGPGVVCFPETELNARDFIRILEKMHKARTYGKMVIYLEACESGSMFQNLLPAHWNIFATTAANAQESSYGCYYDNLRQTMLGDTYSVNWMEDSDATDLSIETLQRQFIVVKGETTQSHVQEFGDKTLRNLPVANFLGVNDPKPKDETTYSRDKKDQVDSREVVKEVLQRRLARATAENDTEAIASFSSGLRRLNKLRKLVRSEMHAILREVTKNDRKEMETLLTSRLTITNWDCYERVAKAFSKECFSIAKNSYVTGRLFILVNLCERGWETERILSALSHTCQHNHITGIY